MLDCCKAFIEVERNLCGFLLTIIEIKDKIRGYVFLRYENDVVLDPPNIFNEIPSRNDLSKSLDLYRLHHFYIDIVRIN